MVRAEISGHAKQIIVDFVKSKSLTTHNSGSTSITCLADISDRNEWAQQCDHECFKRFFLLVE